MSVGEKEREIGKNTQLDTKMKRRNESEEEEERQRDRQREVETLVSSSFYVAFCIAVRSC